MTAAATSSDPDPRAEAAMPLLERARTLVQEFPVRGVAGGVQGGVVHAVSDVSFDV